MESFLILSGVLATSFVIAIGMELLHCWLDDRKARR
jgi:hypothetical protein